MGWHLFVLDATGPAATASGLEAASYRPTDHRVTVDEAVSDIDDLAPGGLAVVEREDGLQAVARLFDDDDLAATLSADGGQVVTLLWHSVASTYVLTVFRDGRLLRRLVRAEGEVVVDEGPALPEEADVRWDDPEDAMFALGGALLGEPIGDDAWLERPATIHQLRPRRRWWR